MSKTNDFIERQIIIGMICSSDYLRKIALIYQTAFLKAREARLLASWCLRYFKKYEKAPKEQIETIYQTKLRQGKIKEKEAVWIEKILISLSEEQDKKELNEPYLYDEAEKYFNERILELHVEDLQSDINDGNTDDARLKAASFASIETPTNNVLDMSTEDPAFIREALAQSSKPLIRFPHALQRFWGDSFTRDSFVGIQAPEKRGKSFMLYEIAMRGVRSHKSVALFQCGDMSMNQQFKRHAIYLSQRNIKKKYCDSMYVPVLDCLYNQRDTCKKKRRQCDFGVFENESKTDIFKYTFEDYIQSFERYKDDYAPCTECLRDSRLHHFFRGNLWYEFRPPVKPLTWKDVLDAQKKFRKRYKNKFKTAYYSTGTLSVPKLKDQLHLWRQMDDFIPDIIVTDFADLMTPGSRVSDHRHKQNEIWSGHRGLAQDTRTCVVTATQADAASYEQDSVQLKNYSEDKRKYGHVTAMYSLNQNPEEKKKGIMRIGELLVREGDFDVLRQVKVLQRLQIGRPVLGSFF